MKLYLRDFLASKASGKEPDRETTLWFVRLNNVDYAQLVDAGLEPTPPSIENLFEQFMDLLVGRTLPWSTIARQNKESAPTET